jgi:hypothetical protein
MVAPTKVPAIQTTQGPDHVKAGRLTRQRAIIMASASKAGAGQFIWDFPQRDWSKPASHIGHAQDQLQPIKDRRPTGPRDAMAGAGLMRQ